MTIAVIADGSVDLNAEMLQQFNIQVLPSQVQLDIGLYDNLETTEVLDRMMAGQKLTNVQTDDHVIRASLQQALMNANEVLLITVSRLLDPFHDQAQLLAREFGGRITVVDSKSVSIGIGLQAIRAAKMAQEGRSVQEIVAALKRVQANNLHLLVVKSLDFMRMTRRISGTQAVLGKFLGVNPILGVRDGKISGVEQVRGFHPALKRMKGKGLEYGQQNARANIIFWYTPGSDAELRQLQNELVSTGYFNDLGTVLSGPAIAANTGPGAIGFYIEPAEV